MPNYIPAPASGAPYSDCIWKVSQRKAPGAMSAMALTVNPVKPRVALLVEDLPPPSLGMLLAFVTAFAIVLCDEWVFPKASQDPLMLPFGATGL